MFFSFDCHSGVFFNLLSDLLVVDVRKGYSDHISKMVNHIVDVICGFKAIWVNWRCPCAGKMVTVLDGCSELGSDHGWPRFYKDTLQRAG